MLGPAIRGVSATLRALAVAATLSGAFASAGAAELKEDARNAAIGDGISTAVGLAAGAAELNPLGPVLSLGVKAVLFQYAETLPDTDRPRVYAMAASTWGGAAANNICVAAALLTGGGFAPACIAVGVAWGMKTWQASEHERQFWEGCAMLRAYADNPELQCVYTPQQQPAQLEAALDLSTITAQAQVAP